jgi:endonuclease/exonuclease/phosphatase (EEP) superfamily protein YafD
VLALLLVAVSILPLWQTDRWWVRQWDYPRLQVAGLLVLVGAALPWAWGRRGSGFTALAGAMVVALAWQVSHFIAYLPPYPKEVPSAASCPAGQAITLLNANVLQTNDHYGALLKLVADTNPDLVLLLETGPRWASAMKPLSERYRYRLSEPIPSTYGMMLFSRLPMAGEVRHLLQPAVPSIAVRVRLPGGQEVDFHALHPEPPWPGDNSGERDAELISVGREVRQSGRAAIVMGDLNDVAWSRTSRLFKRVSGMGDPRVGRGFYPTFNANYPLLRWPLDHLFVSPHFAVTGIDLEGDIGSDHLPILFRLCLKASAAQRKIAPSAGPAVEADANEELREGVVERSQENHGD